MDVQREPAASRMRTVVRGAIRVDEEVGVGVVSTGLFLLVVAIFIPIGILTFVATALVLAFVSAALGGPTGALAALLGVGWFAGTLALLVVVFSRVYRRLPRRMHAAMADPASIVGGDSQAVEPSRATSGRPEPSARATAADLSLAELDAHLAPPPRASTGPNEIA